LRRGDELFARVIQFSPLDAAVTARLLGTILNTVSASVNGVLAVAAAQGLALSFGFWMADVRSPLLWGMVGGVASLIPLLGCPLVWVPVVVAFAFMGAWWKVVFLSVWGALIVGSIDNIVRPLVVSASTKLHPLLMAIAALGGTYAFGVLGILLGPLVVSVAGALVVEIQTELEAARANEISTA
jgi:predicted PurR-regulated permease PerM